MEGDKVSSAGAGGGGGGGGYGGATVDMSFATFVVCCLPNWATVGDSGTGTEVIGDPGMGTDLDVRGIDNKVGGGEDNIGERSIVEQVEHFTIGDDRPLTASDVLDFSSSTSFWRA